MTTKRLKYTGTRLKPFTIKCPSGARYPVEPEVTTVIEVAEADALHLLGSNAVWQSADTPLPPDEPPSPSTMKPPKKDKA